MRALKWAGVLITDSKDGLFLIRDEGFSSSHDPERDRTTDTQENFYIVSYYCHSSREYPIQGHIKIHKDSIIISNALIKQHLFKLGQLMLPMFLN